jgi:hypothetical protein
MNLNFWTLRCDGFTKTFAQWGISSRRPIVRTLRNQAIDTLTFTVELSSIVVVEPFAADELCRVYRDGHLWFSGVVTKIARRASAAEQVFDYELSGGWYWLENLTYQQLWNFPADPDDPDSALSSARTSRINLFQNLAGTRISTIDQITEAIDYTVAHAAPIALGVLDLPEVKPPFSQLSAQSCAEIIRGALRWHPDAVTHWDYSVYPPQLNITSRSACAVVEEPFADAPSAGVQITPRHDLVVAGVRIIYEQTHSIDETSWSVPTIDEAGDPDTFGSVVTPVELGGSSATYQRQKLSVTAWEPADDSFWVAKFPALALAHGPTGSGSITVENAKVNGVGIAVAHFINEITDGAVPQWLDGTTVEATVTADLSYSLKNPTTNAEEVKIAEPRSYKIKLTTLFAGANQVFSQLTSATDAEPIPIGVADAYYAAASVLHYEGQWTIIEREVSSLCGLGNVLNLTGGPTEWETMNALIQQVTENVETGTTTLNFGAPQHLSTQDFVALLRVQRDRKPSWRLQERVDGHAYGDKAQVDGATQTPVSKPDQPPVPGKTIVLAEKPDDNPSKLKLTTDDIVAAVQALTDKDVKLRPIQVCEDGETKTRLFLCSAPY